ncbi:MAG TPA: SDR family NAD(P)-dependent oxidoreductase [Alcaligenes sp.]|nr:SDR family NAD(P)-dependent oxidoreductase [Alcaligenes sp.]HRL28452.1 SDR family NAD(P)-dependent oxidoreductase [Alcaligenes sp.]
MTAQNTTTGLEIALVGMAGRFPGAEDVQTLWERICQGTESVVQYSEQQLRQMGVPDALLQDPDYVRAGIEFDALEQFDAALFAYTPRDAQLLDPQHRVFLECAWHALEHAGYMGDGSAGRAVGVFAGCGASVYLIRHLLAQTPLNERTTVTDMLSLLAGNGPDSLATRVAYKLNLQGPAVAVQTACSSSLVAVHMACQSLLNHECDMALAGGVSLNLLQKGGYLYRNGAIFSRDGHCRAFDAKASGTVLGSGAGVVVLKRLEEAIDDGDTIHAVIKGSAINNDGTQKVGFTAPSIQGQAHVVQAALAMADVPADSIGYIEAHGTGTVLGDPIEVAALTQAFGAPARPGSCALGSIKTNIGHLDTAAGVAGLIKTALALRHQVLPASLNFDEPNPQIDFADSPFYVNTQTRPWPAGADARRAGVSSFGIGGTNAHVVLQEHCQTVNQTADLVGQEAVPAGGYALPVSGHTSRSLSANRANLADYLHSQECGSLQAVSSTLIAGRRHLGQRCIVLAHTPAQAAQAFLTETPNVFFQGSVSADAPAVAFMFPGQGAQHVGMGRSLYQQHALYRQIVDECCQILEKDLGLDIRQMMFAAPDQETLADEHLSQTRYTQPALFVMEYALARLWMSWGIAPQAMIGHSIGEYVAACLAGVFTLDDALRVVALRGKLLQKLAPGAMLAVGLSEHQLLAALPHGCDIAAVNTDALCVLSGSVAAIEQAQAQLGKRTAVLRRLHVSHAFHSALVEPMLDAFAQVLSGLTLSPPAIPFISNLSGTWISPEQAVDPAYWVRHVRGAVRFADGVGTLLALPGRILLEVGPGQTLSALARQHPGRGAVPVLASQSHPRQLAGNAGQVSCCLAQLWVSGVDIDASPLFKMEHVRRIPLPLYAFDRQSYWVAADAPHVPDAAVSVSVSDAQAPECQAGAHVYAPVWQRQALRVAEPMADGQAPCLLIFGSNLSFAAQLQQRWQSLGYPAIVASAGPAYRRLGPDHVELRADRKEDVARLLSEISAQGKMVQQVCATWALEECDEARAQAAACSLFIPGLLNLARAFGALRDSPVRFTVLTSPLNDVTGTENLCAAKSLLQGPCRVMGQEYEHIDCRLLDLDGTSPEQQTLEQVLAELQGGDQSFAVAYRGRHRWVQLYEPYVLQDAASASALRRGGTYLITGGLGGIGWHIAEHLARHWQANLVLIGRYLDAERQTRLDALRRSGVQVLACVADLACKDDVRAALQTARQTLGAIHGVVHAAGVAQSRVISQLRAEDIGPALAAKVQGTQHLLQAIEADSPDFVVLFSSLASVLGGLGKSLYASANAYLDALAHAWADKAGAPRLISINWDGWRDIGMAAQSQWPAHIGIRPQQGMALLEMVLSQGRVPQLLVSTSALQARWRVDAQDMLAVSAIPEPAAQAVLYPRPSLAVEYVEPDGELEDGLAALWGDLLGMQGLGSEDSLFELGGDSLLAIQLLAKVKATYGVDVPPAVFFQDPTIAALAAVVEAELIDQIEQDSLAH